MRGESGLSIGAVSNQDQPLRFLRPTKIVGLRNGNVCAGFGVRYRDA